VCLKPKDAKFQPSSAREIMSFTLGWYTCGHLRHVQGIETW